MFVLYGRRNVNIKKFLAHHQQCPSCAELDTEIKVSREYFHIFFVPLCPVGVKNATLKCRQCGKEYWSDAMHQQYENKAKTPLYFYSWPVLFVILIATIVVFNLKTQKEKAEFVADPKVGDVYLIRNDEKSPATYFFLRLDDVYGGDSIVAVPSYLEYSRFVSKMEQNDFFDENEAILFLKSDLKKMLEDGVINAVERKKSDE